VRQAIQRQNRNRANVTSGARAEVAHDGTHRGRALPREIVATIDGTPVRVRDAPGRGRHEEQRSTARLNGVPTVVLECAARRGRHRRRDPFRGESLGRLAAQLPTDVRLEPIRDQSRFIDAALHEIELHLVLGSILASLVVLAFMRSWRSTVIAAVAIPASVVSTFGVMAALDFTLNSVTMLALVLMVGVVIDDAIVVLENIFRFVEEKGMPPMEAARAATAEIGLAVLATTLSLVVIFVPVSFMSSISGRFLYQFGITAAVAVLVSLLVSFTLTPMMSARMLRAEDAAAGGGGGAHPPHGAAASLSAGKGESRSRRGFYAALDRTYERLLAWSMGHRKVVLAVAGVVVASSVPLYLMVRQEYTPGQVDEAEFEVNVNAPEGTSLASMDEIMRAVEAELRASRGVRIVLATVGGGFLGNVGQGNAYVRIAPHSERTLSPGRVVREILHGRPLAAFTENYDQRSVRRSADGCASSPMSARRCGTRRASTSAAGTGTSTSCCAART
jgi:HAE1 family hydrophobic/amphiphilic exporter-1